MSLSEQIFYYLIQRETRSFMAFLDVPKRNMKGSETIAIQYRMNSFTIHMLLFYAIENAQSF